MLSPSLALILVTDLFGDLVTNLLLIWSLILLLMRQLVTDLFADLATDVFSDLATAVDLLQRYWLGQLFCFIFSSLVVY